MSFEKATCKAGKERSATTWEKAAAKTAGKRQSKEKLQLAFH